MAKPMDKIRYGKWGGLIAPLGVLFRLFALITAQPGFLSISCGANTSHTAENNITWVTDSDYIDVGKTADIGDASSAVYGSYLHSLRYFPKPLNRSCYQLPVAPNVTYLLRLSFAAGNFSSGYEQLSSSNITFSIETLDMLANQSVNIVEYAQYSSEYILATSGTRLYICLVRTSETYDPFISAIELRRLQNGMYGDITAGTMWAGIYRYDVGGNSTIRYPEDKFDRIWTPYQNTHGFDDDFDPVRIVSSEKPISTNNTPNLPPTTVMQTAWVVNGSDTFNLHHYEDIQTVEEYTLLVLYFAEVEMRNVSESRSFHVLVAGERLAVTLLPNYSAVQLSHPDWQYNELQNTLVLNGDAHSTLPPLINAYEYYLGINTDNRTDSRDLDALDAMKRRFDLKDWISDPCYLIPWDGIGCDNTSPARRISEIDLSGRNLTGSMPNDIAELTGLVNVSLDNNHFTGTMPNFSNLKKLERLYLQNNNLNGTFEWLSKLKNLKVLYLQNNNFNGTIEWLSKLKNLKELNIENNNFNGVIPTQLLRNCSLKLMLKGNPHLRMNKRECIPQKKNKRKVVLGITLSGIALTVGILVCGQKLWRKQDGVATERNSSIIMMPTPTNARAFTLHEMITATQNFSREIGKGGFGSVFFGKLPEGRAIAVKVLSLSSQQGIHEFLNEVNLLSKINHRNLVSLLGYCNKRRKAMLIYDYMSGGTLRDHLYGCSAEISDLNWKRRLKIVSDAAQGLEYLHVGCTPKIIHRDIKTANILLDSNLNGKLADFGLSRMTIDGEATHVTTTVKGTIGYLDPEYYNTQMLTEKSDVYSFGVVLLEIICGRAPIDIRLPEEEVNIVRWVTPYLVEMDENGDKIIEIIDKRLCGGCVDLKSMTSVFKIAMRCVEAAPSSRPAVSEIVAELKEAINHEGRDYISILEQSRDSLAGPVESTKSKGGMEWSDNSSNIPNEGR